MTKHDIALLAAAWVNIGRKTAIRFHINDGMNYLFDTGTCKSLRDKQPASRTTRQYSPLVLAPPSVIGTDCRL
ncbi:hypothetical protein [Agrobacterium sp. V1]|uniref:hypothetical protein n=1 Tax=Agrobacterium sp. V1 TaxID=3061957 RepID=UPI002673AE3F|nr:hypothetical protein [Agrobacterium sp. V1]MDO3442893.1 hypothetical protein [Agrobacterium sp. V1]